MQRLVLPKELTAVWEQSRTLVEFVDCATLRFQKVEREALDLNVERDKSAKKQRDLCQARLRQAANYIANLKVTLACMHHVAPRSFF